MTNMQLGEFSERFTKFHRIPEGFKIVIRERRGKKRIKRADSRIEASPPRKPEKELGNTKNVAALLEHMQRHAPVLREWTDEYKFSLVSPEKREIKPNTPMLKVRAMEPAVTVTQKAEALRLQSELARLLQKAESGLPPRMILRAAILALKSRNHRGSHIAKAA